jgi:hypothetical protein
MQKIIIAALTLALVGCATKPQYSHSTITDPGQAERQMAIDDGACTATASGAAPVPQVQASEGSRTISGTATNQNGETFAVTGTTKPKASGFSSGFASGMNMRAAADAKAAQQKIYNGCMVSKGWTK